MCIRVSVEKEERSTPDVGSTINDKGDISQVADALVLLLGEDLSNHPYVTRSRPVEERMPAPSDTDTPDAGERSPARRQRRAASQEGSHEKVTCGSRADGVRVANVPTELPR